MKIALVLLLLFASAEAVQAQSAISPEMQSGVLWQRQTTSTPTLEVRNTGILGDGSNDYRYTGLWVGAGTGVGLAYLAHRFCNDSDTGCSASAGQELFGTLFLTVIMGTFGALIGAQFER